MTENDLHKFVDDELGEAKMRLVASVIAADAALGRKVEQYREINRRLDEIYNDSEPQPLPSRFLVALAGRGGMYPWRAVAAVLWLAVGAVIGYSLQGPAGVTTFVRPLPVEAAFAHAVYVPEVRHPVEVGAAQQEHLNAWLSKRLERPIAAPDLRKAGYTLIGGRLLPDAQRPAAQFMFEDAAGKRLTLYIRHAMGGGETSFSYAKDDGYDVVYWIDDGLAYAMTATVDRAILTAAAQLVYSEINH